MYAFNFYLFNTDKGKGRRAKGQRRQIAPYFPIRGIKPFDFFFAAEEINFRYFVFSPRLARDILHFALFHGFRVVPIQHKKIVARLVFKDPCLCIAIFFERMIPVKMVRRHIKYRSPLRPEVRYRLKLKTRNLGHIKSTHALLRPVLMNFLRQSISDIPAEYGFEPAFFHHKIKQSRCCRLPVCSGDRKKVSLARLTE